MNWWKDDLIDGLIEANRARSRPGMDRPDYAQIANRGEERRIEVEMANRRCIERTRITPREERNDVANLQDS